MKNIKHMTEWEIGEEIDSLGEGRNNIFYGHYMELLTELERREERATSSTDDYEGALLNMGHDGDDWF